MSLLIKALDKAQEEAQTAKGKQKAKQSAAEAPLAKAAANADNKRQPVAFNPAATQSFSVNDAASEKMAVANALELELSPTIKTDNAAQAAHVVNDLSPYNQEPINQELSTSNLAASRLPVDSKASALGKNSSNASNSNTVKPETINQESSKKSAANVFAAKRIEASHQNAKIAFIVGAGVLVLSAVAAYFYQWPYGGSDVKFVAQRPLMPAPVVVQAQPAAIAPLPTINPSGNLASTAVVSESLASNSMASNSSGANSANPPKNSQASIFANQQSAKAQTANNTLRLAKNEKVLNDKLFDGLDSEAQPTQALKENQQFETNRANTVQIASKSASIQVSRNTEQAGVNPVLMRAYDAYNANNDTDAIKLYKQVLQRDVRNVDALLGLGSIAQRQGRLQDANGWYGKVLELDPKNSIALNFNLAAQLDNQAPNDINNESRIKNMLAKQPDDASLHATLGNFYADTNQWSAAQQAYFDAYRLNANADNAYNLAISLDQMGKPKLALPYYQRALQLSQTTRTTIDKTALEARISAIQ